MARDSICARPCSRDQIIYIVVHAAPICNRETMLVKHEYAQKMIKISTEEEEDEIEQAC